MNTTTVRINQAQEYLDAVIPQRLNSAYEYVRETDCERKGNLRDEAPVLTVDVTCNGLTVWLTLGGPGLWVDFTRKGSRWVATAGAAWGGDRAEPFPIDKEDVENLWQLWDLDLHWDMTTRREREQDCHGCDVCEPTETSDDE